MHKHIRKALSLAAALVMCLGLLPMSALAAGGTVAINAANFPDPNFRAFVSKLDPNKDAVFTPAELTAITEMKCSDLKISNLKGIEHFTALKRLDCDANKLTHLDVSGNPRLEWLDCTSNQLTGLNVRKNFKLIRLYCAFNQLTQLDVSGNPELEDLICADNPLSKLDVSKNPALVMLHCSGTPMTQLNLDHNPMMQLLDFSNTKITKIGLSRLPRLRSLTCRNNQMTELDVSKNPNLHYLDVSDNKLTRLNVSMLPGLVSLNVEKNLLRSVDTSKNSNLSSLDCRYNLLTELDVTRNSVLTFLNCGYNQLKKLDMTHNPKLVELYCYYNRLEALDVTHAPGLRKLVCFHNQLAQLDMTQNPKLVELDCSSNRLAAVNLHPQAKPSDLDISQNRRSLDDRTPLSRLPGLDLARVSNIKGGSFKDGVVNFTDRKLTYDYDCGSGQPTTFTLNRLSKTAFSDVTKADYFYNPVRWAVTNEITAGIGGGLFAPDQPCTRAQIVTFLWNAKGKPEPRHTKSIFTDVAEDDWFFKPIMWAFENRITAGIGDNQFGPELPCTRAQAMTFLWKFVYRPEASSRIAFSDVAEKDWFYEPVRWAVQYNVTSGVGGNRFGAEDTCLRAQIVTFMYQALQ